MTKNSAAVDKKSRATGDSNSKKVVAKDLHVVHHGEGWVVRDEGSFRVRSLHNTQREAIEVARPLAESRLSTLVIHHRDGRVKERNSFRRDPLPPPKPRRVLYPTTPPRTATKEAIKKAVREAIKETNKKLEGNKPIVRASKS